MEGEMAKQIFDGLKVIEFAWAAVGPQVCRELAEHGATVIKVESHRRLDLMRTGPPFKDNMPSYDRSVYFAAYNTAKLSLSVDLTKPDSKDLVRRLVSWADFLGEAWAPGVMAKLGLDYDSCRKINPGIIYFSTCMLGQSGRYRDFTGVGNHLNAIGGFCHATGFPGGEPTNVHTAYSDFIAPWYIVIAVVGALLRRRKTGVGMYMEQAQLEAALSFQGPHVLDCLANQNLLGRRGNRDQRMSPHGVYPCRGADRWVAIAAKNDEDWQCLCRVMGDPEWAGAEKFNSIIGRKDNEDELDRFIGTWTRGFLPEQLMAMLQGAGIAAGVVQTGQDLLSDPHLKAREHFRTPNHQVIGPHSANAPAYKLSRNPCDMSRPAPCLGQHNAYVLKGLLGFNDDQIADMLVNGVITTDADAPKTGGSF
jgi:benzylsuccinate CoA-transferase BbsF subunit